MPRIWFPRSCRNVITNQPWFDFTDFVDRNVPSVYPESLLYFDDVSTVCNLVFRKQHKEADLSESALTDADDVLPIAVHLTTVHRDLDQRF